VRYRLSICTPTSVLISLTTVVYCTVLHSTYNIMSALSTCVSIGRLTLWLGFFGLLLDMIGALLIVLADVSALEFLSIDSENKHKAEILRQARQNLFQSRGESLPRLEEGDTGFGLVKGIIIEESGTELNPIKITAKPPGTLGGGGNVFIYEGQDIDEPHDGVGSHNLVDGWIQQKIRDLEKEFRDRYRKRGMQFLLIGFTGQMLSYLLRNSTWLQDVLVSKTLC